MFIEDLVANHGVNLSEFGPFRGLGAKRGVNPNECGPFSDFNTKHNVNSRIKWMVLAYNDCFKPIKIYHMDPWHVWFDHDNKGKKVTPKIKQIIIYILAKHGYAWFEKRVVFITSCIPCGEREVISKHLYGMWSEL